MSHLIVLRSRRELRDFRASLGPGARVGFVPTMGALHDGHLSLVQQALRECTVVIASIFVNPLQFGPNEDLSKYPRPLEKDLDLLRGAGCHAVFVPSVGEMYPSDASTVVVEESLSQVLCGAFRPGHFRGVATVVLKLFNLVQPHVAYFGQKDAQQCSVIERMVRDLELSVKIVRGPTVREDDGLARSSRNIYLSSEERAKAPLIHRSMQQVREAYRAGERDVRTLEQTGRKLLEAEASFRIQYYEIRSVRDLVRPEKMEGGEAMLVAVAAHLGTTRLIDNLVLD
jgi:pantoate--beta-alanine ligase